MCHKIVKKFTPQLCRAKCDIFKRQDSWTNTPMYKDIQFTEAEIPACISSICSKNDLNNSSIISIVANYFFCWSTNQFFI